MYSMLRMFYSILSQCYIVSHVDEYLNCILSTMQILVNHRTKFHVMAIAVALEWMFVDS